MSSIKGQMDASFETDGISGDNPKKIKMKKFMTNLTEGSTSGERFEALNVERVKDFINKPMDDPNFLSLRKQKEADTPDKHVDYRKRTDISLLQLQKKDEFQKDLGFRSRFGDGDGSFFDLWLNSEGNTLPICSEMDGGPKIGFKHYYMLNKPNFSPFPSKIKPYAEFKKEYLQRKAQIEASVQQNKEHSASHTAEVMKRHTSSHMLSSRVQLKTDLTPVSEASRIEANSATSDNHIHGHVSAASLAFSKVSFREVSEASFGVSSRRLQTMARDASFYSTLREDLYSKLLDDLTETQKESYFGAQGRRLFFSYYGRLLDKRKLFDHGSAICTHGSRGDTVHSRATLSSTNVEAEGEEKQQRQQNKNNKKKEIGSLLLSKGDPGGSSSDNINSCCGKTEISAQASEVLRKLQTESGQDNSDPDISTNSNTAVSLTDLDHYMYTGKRKTRREASTGLSKTGDKIALLGKIGKSVSLVRSRSQLLQAPTDPVGYAREADVRVFDTVEGHIKSLHVTFPGPVAIQDAVESVNPDFSAVFGLRSSSPRSRFILSCVDNDIKPDPSLLIRRNVTAELDVSQSPIGDKMATLWALSLVDMPALGALNASSTNLSGEGLTAVAEAVEGHAQLAILNLSRNKFDGRSIDALCKVISSPTCRLIEIVLQDIGLADTDAIRLLKAVAENSNLKILDISNNKLGSNELCPPVPRSDGSDARSSSQSNNVDQMAVVVVGESIAAVLKSKTSSLQSLNLSWNILRYRSGFEVTSALRFNASLMYLDLSFNALARDAAEQLGSSLMYHKSLKSMNLAHCDITGRPCFVIMSGATLCDQLESINLSENPIGESGVKAALSASLARESFEVDVKGCNHKSADPSAWFDIDKLVDTYKLQLHEPYDRAVVCELLRVAAQFDIGIVYSYSATESASPTPYTLKLQKMQKKCYSSSTAGTTLPPTALQLQLRFDPDNVRSLFRQIQTDGDGSLSRPKVRLLLGNLGLDSSPAMLDNLFGLYDADESGTIEENEFMVFFQSLVDSAKIAAEAENEIRCFTTVEDKSISPHIPAESGIAYIKLDLTKMKGNFFNMATGGKLNSLLRINEALDSAAMLSYALETLTLTCDNAVSLFYSLLKENNGDKTKTYIQLLPRIIDANNVRLFFNTVCSTSAFERLSPKVLLGRFYDIYTGNPSGYYSLSLSDERDRKVFGELQRLNKRQVEARTRQDYNDTSQNENHTGGFRNVTLDGIPIKVTREFLESPHIKGVIDFDFVLLPVASHDDTARPSPISDTRLLHILESLQLIEVEDRAKLFAQITEMTEQAAAALKVCGTSVVELRPRAADGVGAHADKLYSTEFLQRRSISHFCVQAKLYEERKAVHQLLADVVAMSSMIRPDGSDAKIDSGVVGSTSKTEAIRRRQTVMLNGTRGNMTQTHVDKAVEHLSKASWGVNSEAYREYIWLARHSTITSSYGCLAQVTLDALVECLMGRTITCAQLAILLQIFPRNASGSTSIAECVPLASSDVFVDAGVSVGDSSGAGESAARRRETSQSLFNHRRSGKFNHSERSLSRKRSPKMPGTAYQFILEAESMLSEEEGLSEFRSSREFHGRSYTAKVNRRPNAQGLSSEENPLKSKTSGNAFIEDRLESLDYYSSYSSFATELVIQLFSQISDLLNFDLVLGALSIEEHAMLITRLGMLNVWNPVKPEGCYSLNLSRGEERRALYYLYALATIEKGDSLTDESFRTNREALQVQSLESDKPWKMPFSWFNSSLLGDPMPDEGVVNFKYFSGGGSGMKGCTPDLRARTSLLGFVSARPQSPSAAQRITLTAAHSIFGSSRTALSGLSSHTKRDSIV